MEQTADYITDVPRIMWIPFLTFIYTLVFLAFWTTATLYIHTQGIQRQYNDTFLVRIRYTNTIMW